MKTIKRIKIHRRIFQRKPLPVKTVCRNCGTQTVGRYCHVCGQDIFAGRELPIFSLIWHLFVNAFSLDNKTPATLRYLLFRPGFLPAEYRLGKIVRYVHPVKLFWMSTLIFFALLIATINWNNVTGNNKESQAAVSQTEVVAPNILPDKPKKPESNKNVITNEQIKAFFSTFAPYVTFLFIPVFALLLSLFFRKNKFYYVYHLTFAVHFHAFLWIFLSLLIAASYLTGDADWSGWVDAALFFLPGVYLAIALYRFYNPKKKRTAVWKAILLTLIYLILIFCVTIALLVALAQIYFPEEMKDTGLKLF